MKLLVDQRCVVVLCWSALCCWSVLCCCVVLQDACRWTLCSAAVWRGAETSWRCSQRAPPSAPSPTSAALCWRPWKLLDGSESEWRFSPRIFRRGGWISGRLNLIYFVHRWGPNTGDCIPWSTTSCIYILRLEDLFAMIRYAMIEYFKENKLSFLRCNTFHCWRSPDYFNP